MLSFSVCAAVLAAAVGAAPRPHAVDSTVWSHQTAGDIKLFMLHPLGAPRAYVVTPDALVSLDTDSGTVRWTRADITGLPADQFAFVVFPVGADTTMAGQVYDALAIVRRDGKLEAIDPMTGEKRWDSSGWGVEEVRGYLPVTGSALVRNAFAVALAKVSGNKAVLLGVELATGVLRWRSENTLTKNPPLWGAGLFGHQPAIAVDSTAVLLYVSGEGPLKIESRTGNVLWRSTVLKGQEVPISFEGYGTMVANDSLLFVPSENRLVAIRVGTGGQHWGDAPKYARGVLTMKYRDWARVVYLELTAHGLLTGVAKVNPTAGTWGDVALDLLDPATGRSRWSKPVDDVTAWPVIRSDTAYLVANKTLLAVDLPSGTARTITALGFRGAQVRLRDHGTLVSTGGTHALIAHSGTLTYLRQYSTPRVSLLRFLVGIGGATRMSQALRTKVGVEYLYVVTNAPDAAGREGISVVRLDEATGAETGRVWLPGLPKELEVDQVTSTVFVQTTAREVKAVRF